MDPRVEQLIERYEMTPLPVEGTLFASTYRSSANTADGAPVGTAMIGLYAERADDIRRLTVPDGHPTTMPDAFAT